MENNFYKKLHPLGLSGATPKTLEQLGVKIELATEEDWEDYKNLRIEAINTDPDAFSLTDKKKAARQINRDVSEWKNDTKEQIVVLSKQNSRAVGMTKGIKREEGVFSINAVYVTPDFRKRNTGADVAREMIEKVLEEIKKNGGTQARLWVKSSNDNAIKLYENLGFKKINLISSPKRILELTGNRPDLLIGWQIMELDIIKK